MMQRVQYHRWGGPEVMRLDEVAVPEPGRGEIRVRVHAASANPADWKVRAGGFRFFLAGTLPRGLGHDFAGIVDKVGSGVARHKVGDAVYGLSSMRRSGAFADFLIVPGKEAYLRPENLSFEVSAALPMAALTAWSGVIDSANVQAGQSVFVSGCLGAVGRSAVQLALMRSAIVAGNCSASGRDEALAMGMSDVADYRTFNPDAYRGRFDLVYDTIGGLTLKQCKTMLKRGGYAVHATPTPRNLLSILLTPHHSIASGNPNPARMQGITKAAECGALIPKLGRTVPLSDALAALTQLETTGMPKGKLVILPG